MLKRFLRDESGMAAAEYGLIIAVVGMALGAAALVLGNNVAFAVDSDAQQIYALNSAP